MATASVSTEMFPTIEEIPDHYRVDEPIEQHQYLVGGEIRHWIGPMHRILSPVMIRTGDTVEQMNLGATPLLDSDAAMGALNAAITAYDLGHGVWPSMSVAERIHHTESFLARMREQREEIVKLLMWEIAKNRKDSEKEFDRTCDYIVETINALKELDRRSARFEIDQGTMAQIRRVPLGVTLCMGPFNYPLNETFATLIPALIMGNTIVFKPAKYGVLLIRPLLAAFRDCFPPGVVNVIYGHGKDTVTALMETGKIDVFAFIGTNRVASELKRSHPKPHRCRAILGLDAKNPAVVLKSADLEVAAKECLAGALSFNGQRCTALKILFVHETVAESFLEKLTAGLSKLKPGMPWEEAVALTPLPEDGKSEYLKEMMNDALSKGAKIVNERGGDNVGTYFHPAVLYPITSEMRIYSEEQFGPLIPIVPFSRLDEVIEYVVNSSYGQQISIVGKDSSEIGRLIDVFSTQVGRINLNGQCQRGPDTFPFNGRKDSAEGTLSVSDALRQFSIRTLVAAKYNAESKEMFGQIIRKRESSFLTTDYIF